MLSSARKEETWSYNNCAAESDDDVEDPDYLDHSLYVKQALLGTGAKPGQKNLVEVETTDYDGKIIKNVIFTLVSGSSEQFATDIGFFAPATFKLVEGDGPVHLSGCHMVDVSYGDFDEEDESDDEVDDELKLKEDTDEVNALGKRKAANTDLGKKAKMMKVDKGAKEYQKNGGGDYFDDEEDSDEDEDYEPDNTKNDSIENMEDEDDEEEEEEESEEPTPEKKPKRNVAKQKEASKEKIKPAASESPKKKKGKSLGDSPAKKTGKAGSPGKKTAKAGSPAKKTGKVGSKKLKM